MSRLLRAGAAAALLVLLAAASASSASAKTTWLCKPGLAKNPCAVGTGTTWLNADGTVNSRLKPTKATAKKVDCFYV